MIDNNDYEWITLPRAKAIYSGILIDVSDVATQFGLEHPVALTRPVYDLHVRTPDGCDESDEGRRLRDVLESLAIAVDWCVGERFYEMSFEFFRPRENRPGVECLSLNASITPGDYLEPVITVMSPHGYPN